MLKIFQRNVCMCLTESGWIECKRIVLKLRQIDGVILVIFYMVFWADSEVLIAYKSHTLLLTPTMAEAEALQRKKRVRACHRASATRIRDQITTALEATPPNIERLCWSWHAKRSRNTEGAWRWDCSTRPDKELDTEIEQADECQENIFEAVVLINHTLTPVTTPEAPVITAPTIESGVTSPTAPTDTPAVVDRAADAPGDRAEPCPHGAKLRLPKLSLPRFNGDLMKWPTFWDSYESAIHNNDELTEVDKFNYLNAIAGLTLSAAIRKQSWSYGRGLATSLSSFLSTWRPYWPPSLWHLIRVSRNWDTCMTKLSLTSAAWSP